MESSQPGELPNHSRSDLPFWVWGILPIATWLIIAPTVFLWPDGSAILFRLDHKGGGLIEHGTVLILLPGIAAGIAFFFTALRRNERRLEKFWFLLWALACIYFAGEEISWGQHFFHWSTPGALESVNDQKETNLHNISSWLDQKPRALVEAWMIIGGLLIPVWMRLRKIHFAPATWKHWILPTIVCAPAVIGALLTRLFDAIDKQVDSQAVQNLSDSEFREYFIALFLSVYLLSACYRLKRETAPAP